jgi:hypothetical protein
MPNGAMKMVVTDPNVELYLLFNTTKAYRCLQIFFFQRLSGFRAF